MRNLAQFVCSKYKDEITHVPELQRHLSEFDSKLQGVLAELEWLKGVEFEIVLEKASLGIAR